MGVNTSRVDPRFFVQKPVDHHHDSAIDDEEEEVPHYRGRTESDHRPRRSTFEDREQDRRRWEMERQQMLDKQYLEARARSRSRNRSVELNRTVPPLH